MKVKDEVVKYLQYLHPGNSTFELCAMKPKVKKAEAWGGEAVSGSGIVAGWFDDPKKASKYAEELNKTKPEGIYVSVNQCKKALHGRAHNTVKANVSRTKDNEIYRIKNIPIDIDPVRPPGVSASKEEHEMAIKTATKISKYLIKQGFPDHSMIDSGNGAHLIFKTNLDNNEENVRLIRDFLRALTSKYNTDGVKIDEAVSNPSRLIKLPGTYTRKGENLSDRPHRRARILKMPQKMKRVSREILAKYASTVNDVPKDEKTPTLGKAAFMDIEAYLMHYHVEITEIKPYRGGNLYVLEKSLFNENHTPNKASIIQSSEGKLYYQCFHNSCRDRRWNDARQIISGDEKLDKFFKALPGGDSGNEIHFSIMTGAELIQRPIREKSAIKGLLEETGSLLIVGATGLWKSIMTLNIALSLACPPKDRRLWGLFDIPNRIRTLFVQSENGLYGMEKRLKLMIQGNKRFEEALKRISFPDVWNDCRITGDLRNENFQEAIKEKIFTFRARLLVIDPLISFHRQSENENVDMRKVLDELSKLCEVTKTACLVVHHTGKTGAQGVFAGRGASAIADWAANILVLAKEESNRIRVSHEKSRNFLTGPPFTLEVSPNLLFTRIPEPVEENLITVVEVLESLGGQVEDQGTFKEALVKHGVSSDSTALRMINKAVEAGKIEEKWGGKKKGYRLKEEEEDGEE